MNYWTYIAAIIAIVLSIYYFFFKKLKYFKDSELPLIRPVWPILGNMAPAMLRQKTIADLVIDSYQFQPEYKYIAFFDMMNPILIIRDPQLIKAIAVKHFETFPDHRGFVDEVAEPLFGKNLFQLRGEQWRNVRTLLTPAFTSSKMKMMFKLMNTCATDFADFLIEIPSEKRNVFDMKDAVTRYTNDVIATCAFGISVDSMKNPKNEFYMMGKDATFFGTIRTIKFFLSRSVPMLLRLFRIRMLNQKIDDFFTDIVTTTIKTRDEKGITRPDMLQLMMDSRGKKGGGYELTLRDMVSQAFSFFFGGFDSVSTAMCFATNELATNPDIQARLQNEIDKVLEETNGDLTYEALNGMEYLTAVLDETLRKFPIAVFLDRLAVDSFELPPPYPGGKPFHIKKGMNVWFPVYGLHHDSKYYEDPYKFDPERFLQNGKEIHNSGYYMPFGIGPRMCIGNRFALLETKVLLFHLLARCDLKPCSKTVIPMKFSKTGLSMMPEGGFWLRIERRMNPSPFVTKKVLNGRATS